MKRSCVLYEDADQAAIRRIGLALQNAMLDEGMLAEDMQRCGFYVVTAWESEDRAGAQVLKIVDEADGEAINDFLQLPDNDAMMKDGPAIIANASPAAAFMALSDELDNFINEFIDTARAFWMTARSIAGKLEA